MGNSVQINISPDEVKQILLDYYRKIYPNESVDISISANEELVGLYEISTLVSRIKLIRNIKIGKYTALSKEIISEQDIKDIVSPIFDKDNYQVEDVNLITDRKMVGPYENKEIYFEGLEVWLKPKSYQKQIHKRIK